MIKEVGLYKPYCWLTTRLFIQFSHSVMSDSATPMTAAHQASLSLTSSPSLLNLMSIQSVMPSNHLILCHPLPLPKRKLEGAGGGRGKVDLSFQFPFWELPAPLSITPVRLLHPNRHNSSETAVESSTMLNFYSWHICYFPPCIWSKDRALDNEREISLSRISPLQLLILCYIRNTESC